MANSPGFAGYAACAQAQDLGSLPGTIGALICQMPAGYTLRRVYWLAQGAGPECGAPALSVIGDGPFLTDSLELIRLMFAVMCSTDPRCGALVKRRQALVLTENCTRAGGGRSTAGYVIALERADKALPARVTVYSEADVARLCAGARPFQINIQPDTWLV